MVLRLMVETCIWLQLGSTSPNRIVRFTLLIHIELPSFGARSRAFPVRQSAQTVNALRAHMMEFGIAVAKGVVSLAKTVDDTRVPASQIIPVTSSELG
jgi:hypothetical protein